MEINLANLREAIKHLEELPDIVIVNQHPQPPALSSTIKEETRMAKMILKEILNLIEEKATLHLLVERNEEN